MGQASVAPAVVSRTPPDAWVRAYGWGINFGARLTATGEVTPALLTAVATSGGTNAVLADAGGAAWRISGATGDVSVASTNAEWAVDSLLSADNYTPMLQTYRALVTLSASVAGMVAYAGITRSNNNPRGAGASGVPFFGFIYDPSLSTNWLYSVKLGSGTGYVTQQDTGVLFSTPLEVELRRQNGPTVVSCQALLNGVPFKTLTGGNVPTETGTTADIMAYGLGTAAGVNFDLKRLYYSRTSV